jgi:hypothetical protein
VPAHMAPKGRDDDKGYAHAHRRKMMTQTARTASEQQALKVRRACVWVCASMHICRLGVCASQNSYQGWLWHIVPRIQRPSEALSAHTHTYHPP